MRGQHRLALALLLIAFAAFGSRALPQEPATARVDAGVSVVTGGEETAGVPRVSVTIDAPSFLELVRVHTMLSMDGQPGRVPSLNAETFRSGEFELTLERQLGEDYQGGYTYLALQGGGAVLGNRHDLPPLLRAPLWWAAGFVLERREFGRFPKWRLFLGYGHSDISSPPRRVPATLSQAARDAVPRDLLASGYVDIPAWGEHAAVTVSVSVHRAFWGPRATMMVRAGTTFSWGVF